MCIKKKRRTTMFEIEKNIPIPKKGADKKGELRLTLEKMEVGDSIIVPNKYRQHTYAAARAANIKISIRTINSETREMRVWRTK
jgi:hypothetical protein